MTINIWSITRVEGISYIKCVLILLLRILILVMNSLTVCYINVCVFCLFRLPDNNSTTQTASSTVHMEAISSTSEWTEPVGTNSDFLEMINKIKVLTHIFYS